MDASQNLDQTDHYNMFSIRQIVGGCLDWVQDVLKSVIQNYCNKMKPADDLEFDFKNFQTWDLTKCMNYFIKYYNEISKFMEMADAPFGRTLIFTIKKHRNLWAHSYEFGYRDAFRICDAIELFFENLNATANDDHIKGLLGKLQILREQACVHMANEIQGRYQDSNNNNNNHNDNNHNHQQYNQNDQNNHFNQMNNNNNNNSNGGEYLFNQNNNGNMNGGGGSGFNGLNNNGNNFNNGNTNGFGTNNNNIKGFGQF